MSRNLIRARAIAYLRPASPFRTVFPNSEVEIASLFPRYIPPWGNFYVVNPDSLSSEQMVKLATILVAIGIETRRITFKAALEHVKLGAILNCEWFTKAELVEVFVAQEKDESASNDYDSLGGI